ncbi:MAG TPA: transglutaminase domain-containing protein, partial [Niastella sp.]
YKEKNTTIKPETAEEGDYKTYRWTIKNLPAIKHEAGAVSPYPYVMLAPNRFKFDDFEGDLSSWKNFGSWYANLYKGLDKLPPDRVAFFKDMVKDIPDNHDKIKKLYEYMQKNFRYVSIQLGIGGLRPFSAEFTDKKKYGDCKALSNCMKAMLSAVGINSYSAVINAGKNAVAMDSDFPSKFSNHVILCVPLQKDTVWLECTSNTNDYNVLGPFTENRNALLITENGGVLVATPTSTSAENTFYVHTAIKLQDDGSGTAFTTFKTTGEYKDEMKYIIEEKTDDQKEYIVHSLNFKQPDEFIFKLKDGAGPYTTTLETAYEKIHEFNAGNKLFISPRIYKFWTAVLPKAEDRRQDFYFSFPFEHNDTTVFKLPAGFAVEALPKAKDLTNPHATYSTKYWYNETEKAVYVATTLTLKQHKIAAAGYADVKKFFDDILLDETQRIVIKKE